MLPLWPLQVVLLGSAPDPKVQKEFEALAQKHAAGQVRDLSVGSHIEEVLVWVHTVRRGVDRLGQAAGGRSKLQGR